MKNVITLGDSVELLAKVPTESIDLIWTDPPFNTNTRQKHSSGYGYDDKHTDYYGMMKSICSDSFRVLKPTGSLIMLLDYRAVHNVKVILDEYFMEDNFRGEIIWLSELGNISKKVWSVKHCTMLWYTKSDKYKFYFDRVPKTIRKAKKEGYDSTKPVNSVWDLTLSNTDPERVSYPNQKPLAIIEPFIDVHTDVGDCVLDYFSGSGSTAVAAKKMKRDFIAFDRNPQSIEIGTLRLKELYDVEVL